MRQRFALVVVALLLGVLVSCTDQGAFQEAEPVDFTPAAITGERYVLVFNGGKLPRNYESLVAAAGATVVEALPQVGVALVASADPSFAESARRVKSVQAVGGLGYHLLPDTATVVAPETHADAPTEADDLYLALQWDIRRVHAPEAWEAGVTGSHDTVVAVIDTGVASNHPDLAPNLLYAACYAVEWECSAYPDLHYHGTHVAGTIAAAFGHGRAVGVGPDLGLASYNVFEPIMTPEGLALGAYDFPIWQAIVDAADRGFRVINMSLGGYGTMQESAADWVAWNRVANYARQKGTVLVASAGNEDVDLNGPLFSIPGDLPGVINVAATGIRPAPAYPQEGAYDVRAYYSNVGAPVNIAAPGGDCGEADDCNIAPEHLVLSAYVVADPFCAALGACPVGYSWAGGTSMAAPHVAGVAGLVLDQNPRLNANQVSALLRRTADDLGDRQMFGHGMVNAFEATR